MPTLKVGVWVCHANPGHAGIGPLLSENDISGTPDGLGGEWVCVNLLPSQLERWSYRALKVLQRLIPELFG